MGKAARLFENASSQCVRIPKEFRFPDTVQEVDVERDEHGRIILTPAVVAPDIQVIRDLWARDPRDAFERVVPEGRRIFPQEGMQILLKAGVLPFLPACPSASDTGDVPPAMNRRFFFEMEGYGWLEGWKLLNLLGHEDYFVIALVGLGIPLNRIARALSMLVGSSAWSGLGGVGWLWAASKHPGVDQGDTPWASELAGLDELCEVRMQARLARRYCKVMGPAQKVLREGGSLLVFAPTGAGGLSLVENLAKQFPRALTPKTMRFEGHPGILASSNSDAIGDYSIGRHRIEEFLKARLNWSDGAPAQVLFSIQAGGPCPIEKDLEDLLQVVSPKVLPAGKDILVLALEGTPDGPEIAWQRTIGG